MDNNTFYAPNDYRNYLEHFGVKGMKWGVRRYRDYDGSYTQAGVKRYNVTERRYDDAAAKLKSTKAAYKAGQVSKLDLNRAKTEHKEAKRDLKKDYKRLKNDKLADEGKKLYANNKRITSNLGTQARIGIATSFAARMLASQGQFKAARITSIAGGTVAVGMSAANSYMNRRLRAYYGHGGNWSGWAQKNAKYVKQYGDGS